MNVAPILSDSDKMNFRTLTSASSNGDIALVSAIRKFDQKPVSLVCAVNRANGEYELVPLAVMIEGNPYELFEDPTVIPDSRTLT